MLHIVQVVMWGVAEQPLLFTSEEKARSAYVNCAGTRWGQRYTAYCDHHGANGDNFVTARAFMQTIDVSEKSTIHFWTIAPEEAEFDAEHPGSGEMRRMAEGIDSVKKGLADLLADVEKLAESCPQIGAVPDESRTAKEPETIPPAAATVEEHDAEADPEFYTTKEWKVFAATIQRCCCSGRNQSALLPRGDWRQDVYSSRTSLEYWDWLADRIRRYREKAEQAGYTVVAEQGVLGSYQFATPGGIANDDCYGSEWEAWCAAGLHLKGVGSSA